MRDTAILGLGYFGKFHAKDHASLGKLGYIVDADPGKEGLSKKFGAKFLCVDLTKKISIRRDENNHIIGHKILKLSPQIISFIKNTKIWDIVVPTKYHFPLMLLGLEFGKNIFIEKPPTERVSETQYILQGFPQRKIGVDYIEVANPVVRIIRERMAEIKFLPFYFFHRRSKNLVKDRKRSGRPIGLDIVSEELVHDISEIDFFRTNISEKSIKKDFPRIIKIKVKKWKDFSYNYSTNAKAKFSLKFADGATAEIEGSFIDPEVRQFLIVDRSWSGAFYGNTLARSFIAPAAAEIRGRKNIDFLKKKIKNSEIIDQNKQEEILKKAGAKLLKLENHKQFPLLTMIENFYQAKSNKDLICSLERALEYQKIVEQIYKHGNYKAKS